MPFFGLFFTFFGLIILKFPDFLAYIIGFLFLFIGVNSLIFVFLSRRRNTPPEPSWKFGSYELIKKK